MFRDSDADGILTLIRAGIVTEMYPNRQIFVSMLVGVRFPTPSTFPSRSLARPLGVEAALDALDHSQKHTDEKQRSLELALQKARYKAGRLRRAVSGDGAGEPFAC
jgi:hypothetical protein